MSSSKKVFSGVVWSIITNVVNALYGFFMVPILISYFGKAEYGLIGLALSVNAYMQLMDMGLNATNVRFFSNWLAKGDNLKVKKLFSTCTAFYGVVGIINALVLVIVCLFSSSLFNVTPDQNIILQKLFIILAVSAIVNWFTSCYNQIIQATENVAWTQKRILFTKLLMILSIAITVVFRLSITTYMILTVFSNWVILPWVVKKIRSLVPFVSFIPKFDKATFKEILPYTLNYFSFGIFNFSFNSLRPVFLGMQGTVESVADYKIIMGIVGLCSAVTSVFLSTFLPTSSKVIANNDTEGYNKIAYEGTKFITVFTCFCVFGLMSVSRDLLSIYVGNDYLYLGTWLNVFIALLLHNHILGISSLIIGGTNIKPLARLTAITSILSLVIAWVLIPIIGLAGVAVASIVYTLTQQLFYYVYYFPKVMNIRSKRILRHILIPVIGSGAIIWFAINQIPVSITIG